MVTIEPSGSSTVFWWALATFIDGLVGAPVQAPVASL